jgi:phosphatidylglycerol:prolipoprotein diacylglycerol transferase
MIFIQPSIDPILISLGFLDIRWYSLSYIFTFIFGSILIKKLNKKSLNNLSDIQIDKFFVWAVLGVIIGGRVGYVLFYQLQLFFQDPLYIFQIWKGGMSFHGGLIGMIFAIYIFTKQNNLSFFYLSDLVSIVAPIGLFLGRISNFINTELYGRITDFPFAIIYPLIDNNPRHPSQLYEAFFEGVVLFIILYLIFIKNSKKYSAGIISAYFLILYSIFRFLIEFLREPDLHLGLYLNYFSMGQILCIPIFFAGILILFRR